MSVLGALTAAADAVLRPAGLPCIENERKGTMALLDSPPASSAAVPVSEPDPGPEARLQGLEQEAAGIERRLVALRAAREQRLHDDADVTEIEALDRERRRCELRREQLATLLPDAVERVQHLTLAKRADHWRQKWVPDLTDAERQLAELIEQLYDALQHARTLHERARRSGFGPELDRDLVPPPVQASDYCFAKYFETVRQRQAAPTGDAGGHDGSFIVEAVTAAIPPSTPPFRPRAVPQGIIDAQPLHGVRKVRVRYTCRTRIPGYARMVEGQVVNLPARWAILLTHSGFGEAVSESVESGAGAAA
jgi:hypothetical protein